MAGRLRWAGKERSIRWKEGYTRCISLIGKTGLPYLLINTDPRWMVRLRRFWLVTDRLLSCDWQAMEGGAELGKQPCLRGTQEVLGLTVLPTPGCKGLLRSTQSEASGGGANSHSAALLVVRLTSTCRKCSPESCPGSRNGDAANSPCRSVAALVGLLLGLPGERKSRSGLRKKLQPSSPHLQMDLLVEPQIPSACRT